MLAATVETMRRIHAIGFVLGAALTGLAQQASAADTPPAASSRTESTQPEWSAQLLMVSGWMGTTGVYADSSLRLASIKGSQVTYCAEALSQTEADRLEETVEEVVRLDPKLQIADRCFDEPVYVVRVQKKGQERTFRHSQLALCRGDASGPLFHEADPIPDWLTRLEAQLLQIKWTVTEDCGAINDAD